MRATRRRDRHRRLHRQRRAEDDRRRDPRHRRARVRRCSTSTPELRQASADASMPRAARSGRRRSTPTRPAARVLLGVDGVCVISHGSSSARAIVNAMPSRRRVTECRRAAGVVDRRCKGADRRCRLRPTCDREPDRSRRGVRGSSASTWRRSSRSTTTRITLDSDVRRRPRRRLARAHRAGRGARGGARRAHGRLHDRRRRPRRLETVRDAVDCVIAPARATRTVGTDAARARGAVDPATRCAARSSRSGWTFRDHALLAARSRTARGARSTGVEASNERLEFLGDSVLGLVVTDYVFEHYPAAARGRARRRCAPSVVNAEVLAEVAQRARPRRRTCCSARARTRPAAGRSSRSSPTRSRRSIAAVYLDGGLATAARPRAALPRATGSPSRRRPRRPRLQDAAAGARGRSACDRLPRYSVRDEGPDHAKRFFATVLLRRRARTATARAARRRQAEQAAARVAWDTAAGRGERRRRATSGERGCRSYLRSRSCAATSNGGRRQEDQGGGGRRACARSAATSNRKQFVDALAATRSSAVERRGKYLC